VTEIYERLVAAGANAPPVVIVGNKSDLGEQRRISNEEGQRRAAECGAQYVESSAKEGRGVASAFEVLIHEIERRNGDPIKTEKECRLL
jgi:50S ribosomal subunit-associated GTPase HflX